MLLIMSNTCTYIVCRNSHSGHTCAYGSGGRGSWAINQNAGEIEIDASKLITTLTDPETQYARTNGTLSAARTLIYGAHKGIKVFILTYTLTAIPHINKP